MQCWDMVCSVATIVLAVVAIAISIWQTCLSNRQALFQKRLVLWVKASDLMRLLNNNESILVEDRSFQMGIEIPFLMLLNNSWLESASDAVLDPRNADAKRVFLSKVEGIQSMGLEAKFLFKGKRGRALSDFISSYGALLTQMYKYRRIMELMHEYGVNHRKTLDESAEAVGEPKVRKAYFNAVESALFKLHEFERLNKRHCVERSMKL